MLDTRPTATHLELPWLRGSFAGFPPAVWGVVMLKVRFLFFYFLFLQYIQLTPRKLSAERKNRSGAKGASAWPEDQKKHRGRRPGRRRVNPRFFLFTRPCIETGCLNMISIRHCHSPWTAAWLRGSFTSSTRVNPVSMCVCVCIYIICWAQC